MTEMMRAADLPYDDFEAMWALTGKQATVLGSDGRLLKLGIGPNPGMSVILRHGFELHNPDGPALVAADGSKVWYRHNEATGSTGPPHSLGTAGVCGWFTTGCIGSTGLPSSTCTAPASSGSTECGCTPTTRG